MNKTTYKLALPLLLALCGCSLSAPEPLDERSLLAEVEQSLSSQVEVGTTVTVRQLMTRTTEGDSDIADVLVELDEETPLLRDFAQPLDEPALRIESLYRAEYAYEDKRWTMTRLDKLEDAAVRPKEGVNVMALTSPMGRTYVEGAPKERYWNLEFDRQDTDLDNGTDTVYLRKTSENALLTEGGTIKYSYVFNEGTGKWELAEESVMDDWQRTYHIAGQWEYEGENDRVTLTISEVDANGEMTIRMDSGWITAQILSGIDTKTSWKAKTSEERPFVFESDETSYAITIPDEGETNVIKLGEYLFRRR